MKNIFILFFLIIFLENNSVYAQLGVLPYAKDNTDIHVFPSSNDQSECSISINKTNPANIIASVNVSNSSGFDQGNYFTLDGGNTWSGHDAEGGTIPSLGDPMTTFDASGTGYLGGLVGPTVTGYWVQTTSNGGISYSPQVQGFTTSGNQDKEMEYTVDELQTSPYVNFYYCAWTDFNVGNGVVKVNRSTDGGHTFNNLNTLSASADLGQGTTVATGPNGEVYVAWAQYPGGNISSGSQHIGFASSTDGGVTWHTELAPFPVHGIRSVTGGVATFGNTRVNDFPSMAVDKSCGKYRGYIYIVWAGHDPSSPFPGTSTESYIMMSYSADGGSTWSTPTEVDEHFGGATTPQEQSWEPWISVDDLTGIPSIAYYKMKPGSLNTWTYMSSIVNGSYLQFVQVSDVSHIPSPIAHTASGYCGDYIGISSFGGKSYVAWADNRTGNWQMFVSREDWQATPILMSSQTSIKIDAPSTITGYITYQACKDIQVSDASHVYFGATDHVTVTDATLLAAGSVNLLPGCSLVPQTTTNPDADFILATIAPCNECTTPGSTYYRSNENYENYASTTNSVFNGKSGNEDVFAYPVPADDYITIGCYNSIDANAITIYDMNGKICIKTPIEIYNNSQIRNVINISSLSPGTYLFSIDFKDKVCSQKFIKK